MTDFLFDIDWNLATNVMVGVGTISLATVAVFQQNIHNWLRRPKLDLEVSGRPPDCHKIPLTIRQPFPLEEPVLIQTDEGFYCRIKVLNAGRGRAEKPEVFIADISRKVGDNFIKVDHFLPMNLNWSHIEKPFLEAISPGMGKHCNLGYILPPDKIPERVPQWLEIPRDKTIMTLATEVQPNTLTNILSPGLYRLRILLAAANKKEPKEKTLEIDLTGNWYGKEEEMLTKGILLHLL